MAVSIVSVPDPAKIYSASYPILAELTSDKVGQVGITIHRFVVGISVQGVLIGNKSFSSLVPPTVIYDLSRIVGLYIDRDLNTIEFAITPNIFIPTMAKTNPIDLVFPGTGWGVNSNVIEISVDTWESYLEDGVQKTEAGPTYVYYCTRGKSDSTLEFIWANRFDELGVTQLPYMVSSFDYFAFPMNIEKYRSVIATSLAITGLLRNEAGVWGNGFTVCDIAVGSFPSEEIMYISLYPPKATFGIITGIRLEVFDSIAPVLDTYELITPFVICGDEESISLMFVDRYYQWSYLSFPKKNYETIRKTFQSGELLTVGRVQYLPEGIQHLRINSDLVTEDANWLFQDLFMSDEIYMLENDLNDIEVSRRVNITDTNFEVKTSRNNKVFFYSFTIQYSKDIFTP